MSNLATSSREQSTGLDEINTAMNQLDQTTQQNAAMFEETTAATHALEREADALASSTKAFSFTGQDVGAAEPRSDNTSSVVQGGDFRSKAAMEGTTRSLPKQGKRAVVAGASTELSEEPLNTDGWDDF